MTSRGGGQVPAPGLLEVAQTWWDVEREPVVAWNDAETAFDLVNPEDPQQRLDLLRLDRPPDDPAHLARVLAEGLAACDFPPTGTRAAPGRVAATLRAARVDVEPH